MSERFRNPLVTVRTNWSLSYPYPLEICLVWVCSCHAFEPYLICSVGLQRRIILEITAPSLWCRRSVTNIVLRSLMARKVLKATTASIRMRVGALSLGRGLENFSAHSRTTGRIRNQKESFFWGPGQISGFSACLPSSASSSARSFRRHPVWLFTLTSVTLPSH